MTSSHFKVENYAGVILVTFTDNAMLETAVIDQIGKALYDLVETQQHQKLILDFSYVKSLSSHTLGILLTLRGKARAIRGTVRLCGLRPDLMKVFKITNLDEMFQFHANDIEALAAFGIKVS